MGEDGRRLLTGTGHRTQGDEESANLEKSQDTSCLTLPDRQRRRRRRSFLRRAVPARAEDWLRALTWPRRIALLLVILLSCRLVIRASASVTSTWDSDQHPVPQLIARAEAEHARRSASEPVTLQQAYELYLERHGRPPPKGYDAWYYYARRKRACRIGGFDELYRSLAVWWGVEPADIRDRTNRLGDPRSHALGRVRVRKTEVVSWQDMGKDGIARGAEMMGESDARNALEDMLRELVEEGVRIPDVDFFVNQLDEPRVLLPYSERTDLERRGSRRAPRKLRSEDLILRDINAPDAPPAYEVLRTVCSPRSAAQRAELAETPGTSPVVTQRYTSPFTTPARLGSFITDHELERRSWCEQPDLRELHQTLIRPLSFSWTHQLFPIFSNSKIDGFNDILVPAWFHWYRKRPYREEDDVEWKGKANQMFWRGSNTGGRSEGLGWMGWLRSRLVSKVNRLVEWKHYDRVLLAGAHNQTLSVTLPSSAINQALADVAFASPDHHGDTTSLETQVTEPSFRFTGSGEVPFKTNYLYKAILDMDGTAYSGRFPAIMESRSAVIKSRLFIEALADSLIPWFHYIPLSLRLSELYNLLGYFFGVAAGPRLAQEQGFGSPSDRDLDSIRHSRAHEGELFRIASRGREWAQRCTRQDDALVYVYLLGLEWARLCADNRDSDAWSLVL